MIYAIGGGVSFLVALVSTYIAMQLATRIGAFDHPDGQRKIHTRAIPIGGGIAILVAMLVTTILCVWSQRFGVESNFNNSTLLIAFFGGIILISLVGLIDDIVNLRGRQKLAAQIGIAFIMAQNGFAVEKIVLWGQVVELGLLSIPIAMCWLIASMNAFNLIDGVDGLAGLVGVIVGASVVALAIILLHPGEVLLATILIGSLLGFLVFNVAPAKIYLGDAGSMLIGLTLGCLSMQASLVSESTVTLLAPLAIWSLLCFDVLMAVVRRKLTGRSLYTADRHHIHHVLLGKGYSVSTTLIIIGLSTAFCALGGILSVQAKSESLAFFSTSLFIVFVISTDLFGRMEFDLLVQQGKSFIRSILSLPIRRDSQSLCYSKRSGHSKWIQIWETLTAYANRADLCHLQLNISAPTIGEEFHATFQRKVLPQTQKWKAEIPLFSGRLSIGQVTISGTALNSSVIASMSRLIEGVSPVELQLTALLSNDRGSVFADKKLIPIDNSVEVQIKSDVA